MLISEAVSLHCHRLGGIPLLYSPLSAYFATSSFSSSPHPVPHHHNLLCGNFPLNLIASAECSQLRFNNVGQIILWVIQMPIESCRSPSSIAYNADNVISCYLLITAGYDTCQSICCVLMSKSLLSNVHIWQFSGVSEKLCVVHSRPRLGESSAYCRTQRLAKPRGPIIILILCDGCC